jgi:hypothetical protein
MERSKNWVRSRFPTMVKVLSFQVREEALFLFQLDSHKGNISLSDKS